MDGYLGTFVPALHDQLSAMRAGSFTPSDAVDDVIDWGRALAVFTKIWVEGESRGRSEAQRMEALWLRS
jgi:hypothetical protein